MSRPAVIRGALAALRHGPNRSGDLGAYRDAMLRRLVRHAYANVPYYRALFNDARLDPRAIRGVADLDLIPISDKRQLRAQRPEDVTAAGHAPARLLAARTSGSSGEPFTVRRTALESGLQYLYRLRALGALGVELPARIATVGLVGRGDPRDKKFGGKLMTRFGLLQKLAIDGLRQPEEIAGELAAFAPRAIIAMPGMLCRVAEHILAQGGPAARPDVVILGGEVITDPMRRTIARAFGAPVRQTYASHEFPLLAWECAAMGTLHVCDDGVIVEVLREGRRVAPGERGEVVATNLHAYAMPFLRYRLGDVVTRGADRCACGQPFSTLRNVQGRMLDYFSLPGGRVVHPYEILAGVMAGSGRWIARYQLLQEREDRVVLCIVPSEPPADGQLDQIVRSARPVLGAGVDFSVALVDEIPFDSTGKFRPSRSLVRSRYDAL